MIKELNLNSMEVLDAILELQRVSYRIEADIIGFQDIPPLMDTVDTLKECGETFYGYYIDNALAGIISFKVIEDTVDIHRVAVNPNFFRMGIAQKLVSFAEGATENIKRIVVCTGKKNTPAVNLYLKKGYKKIRDIEIGADVYLTEFEKVKE